MRVAFAGTPPFAARALEAILAAGHRVDLVLTQPDRPAGRGMKMARSAVAEVAAAHGLPLAQPPSLKSADAQEPLRAAAPEAMVVAAYGLILPPAVLAIPARGCLNVHASLLPRWRGAAPVQRALLAGDTATGISIMQMDAGLDTGPVLSRHEIAIEPRETAGSLLERLAALGASAIVEALDALPRLTAQPQDDALATYAAKIAKGEARIDWGRSAAEIDRQVRAFNPFPGSETRLGEEAVKIWAAEPVPARGRPGEVIEARPESLVVACGADALRLTELQRAGRSRMGAGEFLRGNPWRVGTRLS